MKKLLCVVPALLLFAMIGAPNAHADRTRQLSLALFPPNSDFGCNYITSTYTAPDVTFPSPTVQTTIEGKVYDVTLSVADAPTDSYSYEFGEFSTGGGGIGPLQDSGVLAIDDLTTGIINSIQDSIGNGVQEPPIEGDGTLTFSPANAATPEPAPVFLMLLGAGLILFMRKRFIMRTPRTA